MSDVRKTIGDTAKERKKKKKAATNTQKRKFTALDFFLVVVLLLCVLGIGFRGTIAEFFLQAEQTKKVTISFKISDDDSIQNEESASIVGTQFFFDEKNRHSFGVVTSLTGTKGTIEMDARYTDSGLVSQDNRSIRVGEIFNIYAGNYTVCVQITEIPRE